MLLDKALDQLDRLCPCFRIEADLVIEPRFQACHEKVLAISRTSIKWIGVS